MAFQLLLHLLLSVIWMVFSQSWTLVGWLIGYVVGLIVLLMFQRFFHRPLYLRKLWAVGKLLLLLLKELLLSGIAVARHIVSPRLRMHPGILTFRTVLQSDWEVTALACLICLTPGTLTLDVAADGQTLTIHALDIADADELVADIRNSFERAILEVRHA